MTQRWLCWRPPRSYPVWVCRPGWEASSEGFPKTAFTPVRRGYRPKCLLPTEGGFAVRRRSPSPRTLADRLPESETKPSAEGCPRPVATGSARPLSATVRGSFRPAHAPLLARPSPPPTASGGKKDDTLSGNQGGIDRLWKPVSNPSDRPAKPCSQPCPSPVGHHFHFSVGRRQGWSISRNFQTRSRETHGRSTVVPRSSYGRREVGPRHDHGRRLAHFLWKPPVNCRFEAIGALLKLMANNIGLICTEDLTVSSGGHQTVK